MEINLVATIYGTISKTVLVFHFHLSIILQLLITFNHISLVLYSYLYFG